MMFTDLLTRWQSTLGVQTPALGRRRGRMVKYYDGKGRKRLTSKEEWRARVLPRQIAATSTDPEKLHQVIANAVACGCADEVIAASIRLLALAPTREKSRALRVAVLIAAHRLGEAEHELRYWIKSLGASIATALAEARLAAARGDEAGRDRALEAVLRLDPNRAEAIEWWTAVQRSRTGMEGHLAALRELAARPFSWRAKQLLASYCLDRRDHERAFELQREAIISGGPVGAEAEALDLVCADLARHRLYGDMVGWLLPAYDVARHGSAAGLELLLACTEVGDIEHGRLLLNALFMRHRHELRDHLQACANRFFAIERQRAEEEARRLAAEAAAATVAAGGEAELAVLSIDQPIWWYGLREPRWLLAEPQRAAEITVLSCAEVGLEDDDAAPLRGLAAYLVEAVRAQTGLACRALIASQAGIGQLVRDREWDAASALDAADTDDAGPRYLLAPTCRRVSREHELSFDLYDLRAGRLIVSATRSGPADALAAMALEITEEICRRLGGEGDDLWFRVPSPDLADDYLRACGDALALFLAQRGHGPRRGVCASFTAFERGLGLAKRMHEAQAPRLLAIAMLALDRAMGSSLHRNCRVEANGLADRPGPRGSPVYRASPLLLWLCDRDEQFVARRAELLADANPDYREWLEAIGREAEAFVVVED